MYFNTTLQSNRDVLTVCNVWHICVFCLCLLKSNEIHLIRFYIILSCIGSPCLPRPHLWSSSIPPTQTHHTKKHSSGGVIGLSQGLPSDNTEHSQETEIHDKRDPNLLSTEIGRLHIPYYLILQYFPQVSAHIDNIIREKNIRERVYKFVITLESLSYLTMYSLQQCICNALDGQSLRYGNMIKYDRWPPVLWSQNQMVTFTAINMNICKYFIYIYISNKPTKIITVNVNNECTIYTNI
jgi:hypothetical protein